MNLFFSILHGILGAIGFLDWLKDKQIADAAMKQGVDMQVSKDTAVALKTETAIAEAEAKAPNNIGAVEDRLKEGTF